MRRTELKASQDGYYRRNLGFTQNGAGVFLQPKFSLGSAKRTAQERLDKITAIWRRVELSALEDEARRPLWDDLSLGIAKAIANGEPAHRMERTCDDPFYYAQQVDAAAKVYPEIRVIPADEELYREGKAQEQVKRADIVDKEKECLRQTQFLRDLALETPGNAVKYVDLLGDCTLHQAFDAYSKWIGSEKFDKSENAVNDTGITRQCLVRHLKSYLTDRPLAVLADFASVDQPFGLLRNRPITRHGKSMARKTASNLIGELSRFFDWLHKSPDWDWRKPPDYDDISHRPIELESDLEVESREIPTYTVDQLQTLYHHATPLERLLLLLGINCAFGADQVGRLKVGEIQEKNGVHYIKRIRRKQKVRGVHRLFKVTLEGLRWAIRGREDQPHAHVLVNRKGHSLWRKTKTGRRCRDIANAWYRLLDRVCEAEEKEKREFPRYGFNTLRDTSADMIRRIGGGEVASAHLTHKHQSGDKNLRRYTNVPWKTVFKAQRRLEKKLESALDGVANPFFDGKGNKGRKIGKKVRDQGNSAADKVSRLFRE